jgi:hypothetical protein
MTDQLEQNLRDAFSSRDAQLDPAAITRLRTHDYQPRRRRIGRLPAFGALGATGLATAAGVIVALGSSAAPAFAGWQATPATDAPGQVTQAPQNCGQGLGAPILTDSRGPYTAAIYSQATTSAICLSGDGVSMSSSSSSSTGAGKAPTLAADGIQFGGGGTRDSAGAALTLSDGRVGSGVTAVTIDLSDGTSVQATVSNGWYLAWWPGDVSATDAQVSTATGTNTVTYPAAPALSCPSGGKCSTGYGFGSGAAGGSQSLSVHSSSRTSAN